MFDQKREKIDTKEKDTCLLRQESCLGAYDILGGYCPQEFDYFDRIVGQISKILGQIEATLGTALINRPKTSHRSTLHDRFVE